MSQRTVHSSGGIQSLACKGEDMTLPIPTFRPGQRVMVTPAPLEQPCPHCGRFLSCYALWKPRERVIPSWPSIEDGSLTGYICPACGGEIDQVEGLVAVKRLEDGALRSALYTWLEPIV